MPTYSSWLNQVERWFELFSQPGEGMYLWARHERIADGYVAVHAAAQDGILLGPGQLFLIEPQPTGWLRFNVAFSLDARLWQWLEKWLGCSGSSQP